MKKFRTLAAVTAAVALLSVAGCSSDADPAKTPIGEPTASGTNTPVEPTETPGGEDNTPVPTPTISANPDGSFEWCKPSEQQPFTGEAADKFGAKNVMDAYCSMVDLEMEYSFLDSMWSKTDGFTEQDFKPVREYLAPNALADFDAKVAKVINGTAEAQDVYDVSALVSFNLVGGSPYTLDSPANFNQRFTAARASVDTSAGAPRLALQFGVASDVALVRTEDKKPMAFTYEKKLTFWLTQGSKDGVGKSWYIDGYKFEQPSNAPVDREDLIKGSTQ